MQFYDIFMLIVLACTTIFGLRKGVAWQIASIASLVVSYFASLRFADAVLPYLKIVPFLDVQPPLNRFVAMLIIYLAVSAGIWLLFRGVKSAIDRVQLREFDHQVGALFGAAKGILLCVIVTFFVVTLSTTGRDTVLKSRSGYYIAWFIHEATPVMPPEVRQVLGPYLDQLNKKLDPTQPNQAAPVVQDWRLTPPDQARPSFGNQFERAAEEGLRRAVDPLVNRNPGAAAEPSPYAVPPTALQPQPGQRPF